MGQGATPYPGAVTSAIDPMQLMAASIMMGMQGKPYNAPPMLGASGMTGIGGQPPSNPTKPYRDWGQPRTMPMVPADGSMGNWPDARFGSAPFDPSKTSQPYGPDYPAGWDPLNNPSGYKNWWY